MVFTKYSHKKFCVYNLLINKYKNYLPFNQTLIGAWDCIS